MLVLFHHQEGEEEYWYPYHHQEVEKGLWYSAITRRCPRPLPAAPARTARCPALVPAFSVGRWPVRPLSHCRAGALSHQARRPVLVPYNSMMARPFHKTSSGGEASAVAVLTLRERREHLHLRLLVDQTFRRWFIVLIIPRVTLIDAFIKLRLIYRSRMSSTSRTWAGYEISHEKVFQEDPVLCLHSRSVNSQKVLCLYLESVNKGRFSTYTWRSSDDDRSSLLIVMATLQPPIATQNGGRGRNGIVIREGMRPPSRLSVIEGKGKKVIMEDEAKVRGDTTATFSKFVSQITRVELQFLDAFLGYALQEVTDATPFHGGTF
ncbi:hypothetical protein MA16_Dca016278 [Dendrobium catenatum]|uniref:Uncharacterized protein n=1 Tax=Dendrobium catenatum TaxID=906689 RepID=A0A2I0WW11_9ASPA|nr:hypothetical protein MA16_Dca016278 [Dendrobium catenatum]